MVGGKAVLITIFFSISDLWASSVVKCTAFLLKLTLAAPKDSLLLIIDGLDSSAEITLEKDDQGKERKAYPMHYLLDMVLLEKQLLSLMDNKPAWEKLLEDQSRLFRVAGQLKYSIGLENIKFQVHLFRKL
jgi:25S rRNA (uracil2843-N3)-methyltransferase